MRTFLSIAAKYLVTAFIFPTALFVLDTFIVLSGIVTVNWAGVGTFSFWVTDDAVFVGFAPCDRIGWTGTFDFICPAAGSLAKRWAITGGAGAIPLFFTTSGFIPSSITVHLSSVWT
jgi:hypothetical protein